MLYINSIITTINFFRGKYVFLREAINLKIKIGLISLLSIFVLSISSCKDKEENVLRLGIIPFESSDELLKNISPMINIISKGLNMEVRPFVATDYSGVIEAFRAKKIDVAFLAPAAYVLGKKEANIKVILKSHRHGNPFFYGVFITRSDSGINSIKDLKGKKFAFGDPISTSGHIFPKMELLKNGINPETDFENVIFAGSHDATVLAVFHKKVDAGATYSDDIDGKKGSWVRYLKPNELSQIKIIGKPMPIPADNICVRSDLDPEITKKLAKTMIDFSNTKAGSSLMQKLYKFDGYMPATDKDYDSVRKAFEVSGIELKEALKSK